MPDHRHTFEPFWPIDDLRKRGLLRYQIPIERYPEDGYIANADNPSMLMCGSYSYLGLNDDPRVNAAAKAAIDRYGTGAMGVRLLAGTLEIHRELELKLADFKQTEDALVFSSGYITNLSVISALVGPGDVVVGDKLDHASIIDGCNLSGAKLVRFAHNDPDSLARILASHWDAKRRLVVIDAVYSMDGDIAPLPQIVEVCRKHGALLMVDEAHSLGVLGKTGHGIEEHFGLPCDCVDIKMGTLSKAIPSCGGYIACSSHIRTYLSYSARAFIYSGALPAPSVAAAIAALDIIVAEPERIAQLHANIEYFRGLLKSAGFSFRNSQTCIFPIICGEFYKALEVAAYCQEHGVFVQAIVPPVVPPNTSRLRATVTAINTKAELDRFFSVLCKAVDHVGGIPREYPSPAVSNGPTFNSSDVQEDLGLPVPDYAEVVSPGADR